MILPTLWNVPESIRARIGTTTYGRQRAIVEEGHVVLVLHKPPVGDEKTRTGELFWRSPAGEWHWNHGGSGPNSVKRHVQAYADLEVALDEESEKAGDLRALFDLLDKVVPLARAARNQHAALQAAREAIKNDAFLIELRDRAYEVERTFDLLVEDVRNDIAYRTAREAEEQARVSQAALRASHRLNLLAALFFPLTALASVFGMNLTHGFNRESPMVFWIIFTAGVGLGFAIKRWVVGQSPAATREPAK
jgi:hypothetical protein